MFIAAVALVAARLQWLELVAPVTVTLSEVAEVVVSDAGITADIQVPVETSDEGVPQLKTCPAGAVAGNRQRYDVNDAEAGAPQPAEFAPMLGADALPTSCNDPQCVPSLVALKPLPVKIPFPLIPNSSVPPV